MTFYYLGSITRVVQLNLSLVSRTTIHRLGDLQLKIMKLLWSRAEATVADLHPALQDDKDLAYTTVATMLRKMEERRLVKHRVDGRSFVYRAAVPEEAVTQRLADHFVDRLFEGSLTDVVSHLLRTRDVSEDELVELERLIAEKKKKV